MGTGMNSCSYCDYRDSMHILWTYPSCNEVSSFTLILVWLSCQLWNKTPSECRSRIILVWLSCQLWNETPSECHSRIILGAWQADCCSPVASLVSPALDSSQCRSRRAVLPGFKVSRLSATHDSSLFSAALQTLTPHCAVLCESLVTHYSQCTDSLAR